MKYTWENDISVSDDWAYRTDVHQQLIKTLGLDYNYGLSRPLIEDVVIEDRCDGILVRGKLTSYGLDIFKGETNDMKKYTPKKIIVNGPATIVMWNDGTKTVVKCEDDHPYANTYDAFNAALAKKIFGTNSHLKKVIDRAIELQVSKIKVDSNVGTTPNETLSEALDKVSDAFRKIWEVKNDGESK